ncbi:MAG: penicillin-binding protein activator, partial [Deltaproteobacteria bacterium]|nr:penicillin-binding protein activator [Deltaproteobacteria bacterium]
MIAWCLALLIPALAASGPPSVVKKAASAGSPEAAAAFLEEALKSASPDDQGWILLYDAEYLRLAGNDAAARTAFEKVAVDYGNHPAREPAKVGLAVIDASTLDGGKAGGNTLATLGLISEAGVPGTLNAERWLLVGRAEAAQGNAGKTREALRRAEASARGTPVHSRVQAAVQELRGQLASSVTVAAPADTRPADLVAIEQIRTHLAASRFSDVKATAEAFATRHADSPFAPEAAYALRRAEKGTPIRRDIVGVALPLGGEYGLPGGQLKEAIELSADALGGTTVAVFDTKGDPANCKAALESLVIDQGAAIVLGPLTRDEALSCAPVAQALHTPMLTFTSADEVLAAGDQVFRPYPSVGEQVGALLDALMGGRGWARFAVLHPTTSFGESAARSFQAAVEARSGTIAMVHGYDPASKDFRSVGKVLGQKDYRARASEFASVRAATGRAGGNPAKPTIDYDAIFVPDSYQRSALLASALAFEEFPIGGFRPRADDVPLGLVGLNAWNNPEWPRRGGDYVRDSVFVDAFWVGSENIGSRDFLRRWRDRGKGDPTVVEAVGWDALRVAAMA